MASKRFVELKYHNIIENNSENWHHRDLFALYSLFEILCKNDVAKGVDFEVPCCSSGRYCVYVRKYSLLSLSTSSIHLEHFIIQG